MSRRLRASIGVDGMRRITQRATTRTQQAATAPGASSRRRSASCLSSCNAAPQWPRVSHRPAAAHAAMAIEAATRARRCNKRESAMFARVNFTTNPSQTEKIEQIQFIKMLLYVCTLCVERLPCLAIEAISDRGHTGVRVAEEERGGGEHRREM